MREYLSMLEEKPSEDREMGATKRDEKKWEQVSQKLKGLGFITEVKLDKRKDFCSREVIKG